MDEDKTPRSGINITPNTDANSDENITQEVGWGLDKGQKRKNNEDSLAAVTVNQASEAETQSIGVYAVADGMGGHDAGEVASKLAVRTAIRKLMSEITETEDNMPDNYHHWLKGAVALANKMVLNKAAEEQKKMGTTLVMAVVAGHNIHIVNVGDSRAYLISSKGIRQITKDHSFVQTLLDSGTITAEEAARHPYRNLITQSVGSQENISIDLFDESFDEDESLLLCSDGVWEMLSDQQIWQIVQSAATPSDACQALVDATNAAGGHDNIAAVLVRLNMAKGGSDDDTAPRPAVSAGQA